MVLTASSLSRGFLLRLKAFLYCCVLALGSAGVPLDKTPNLSPVCSSAAAAAAALCSKSLQMNVYSHKKIF